MIMLTAPMVKKLDQLIAGGGGGGGGSTDLTPVLDAIAAIPAPSGGNVDLTPVLNAVAAVDNKAVALQTSVAAIPTTGGGSTDLTPVLDAIAAIPAPSGGSVDLTPVLNAVAAVDNKAVALQTSVAAIPTTGGGSTDLTPVLDAIAALPAPGAAGSPIKSIQRLVISASIPINSFVDIAIGPIEPSKTAVVMIYQSGFTAAYAKYSLETNAFKLVNTSTQYAVSNVILKLEIIEYV